MWLGLVLGWLAGSTVVSLALERRVGRIGPPPLCTLETEGRPVPLPTPRELRGVPGVGETRSTAIARALWEAGPASDLTAIRGVGPVTAARVGAYLARRIASGEHPAGAGPAPVSGRTPGGQAVHSEDPETCPRPPRNPRDRPPPPRRTGLAPPPEVVPPLGPELPPP